MNERKQFKRMFKDEFDDPNEAFQEFLFSLIPKKRLYEIICKGRKYGYTLINRYLDNK